MLTNKQILEALYIAEMHWERITMSIEFDNKAVFGIGFCYFFEIELKEAFGIDTQRFTIDYLTPHLIESEVKLNSEYFFDFDQQGHLKRLALLRRAITYHKSLQL